MVCATVTVSIIQFLPKINCGKWFIIVFYNKFYLNLMFFVEGTIEYPGLFTLLSLMKEF